MKCLNAILSRQSLTTNMLHAYRVTLRVYPMGYTPVHNPCTVGHILDSDMYYLIIIIVFTYDDAPYTHART